jgi:uncharacterized protein with von Willebrand factor type A (vWA) domain
VITISSLWFWILIEALAATTLIALALVGFMFIGKNRDRKAAAVIIQKIKEDEARRTAETKKILLHKFGFEDDDAEKLAVRTDRAERVLYQSIINMYLQRDTNALEGLNITFETAVEPYRTLTPPGGGGASGGSMDESKELKKLKEENKRLSEEIGVTMQTMGRMLSEYSTMFAEKAKQRESELQQQEEAQELEETHEELVAEESKEPETTEAADPDVVADEAIDEIVNSAKEGEHQGGDMVEEMDDLSDLDAPEHTDLKEIEAPENPDDLIG